MDHQTFIDYITNKINLDDSLDNDKASINIDQAIEGNLIAIREILGEERENVGSIVLDYIETKIENLIKSEEEEDVEMLDCDSFLIRLGRDLNLYNEKLEWNDNGQITEITLIADEAQHDMYNESWSAQINVSLDENGNPFSKRMSNIYDWLESASFLPLDTTTISTGKKIVRFDLDLNQVRCISPLKESPRITRSGRQLFRENINNQQDNIKQHTSLVLPSINNETVKQQETNGDENIIDENMDSISFTNSFNDTTEYVDMGCSPIITEHVKTQSIGTNTENVSPCTQTIGTSPIKCFDQAQSLESNYDRLIKQRFRYLTPIINRTVFAKTKKYFNFFLKRNHLSNVSRVKKCRPFGTNTSPIMTKSRKVQTEENGKCHRKSGLIKKEKPNKNIKSKKPMQSKVSQDSCKQVKTTQLTLSQMFRQTVKEVLQERAISPIDLSLSLIRDYRNPDDEAIALSDFSNIVESLIKSESPDYKSHSPLNITSSIHKLDNLTISEEKKSRRKLYSKSDLPDISEYMTHEPLQTKTINCNQTDTYRRVPLEPKIMILNPVQQIKQNIEIINSTSQNTLDDIFKRQGLCDRLVRVLMTPIEYTKDITYLCNQMTGVYEPIEFTANDSLEVPLNQQIAKDPEFITSSQVHNNFDRAFFSNSFSPISRIVS